MRSDARERADHALVRVLGGEALPRVERKEPYNGADGMPIREEIVATHGTAIITRNAYGARCLNSPDFLFADIDFAQSLPVPIGCALYFGCALGAGWLARAATGSIGFGFLGFLLFAIVAPGVTARWVRWREADVVRLERRARRRVERFVREHSGWHLRMYRTPAGVRLLAMHRLFEPGEPEVEAFFHAVAADPVFVRMCRSQQCFRARVSPKPWRIGIAQHMRPRPGVWPVLDPEKLALRTAWIAVYEEKAVGFASCRYVATFGSDFVDSRAEATRRVHDELSRAESDLPIA